MAHRRAICLTLTVNVVAPIVIYSIASKEMSQASALLLSGTPPAVYTIVSVIRNRRMDLIAAMTLASISLLALIAALVQDAQLLLVKDSIFTCIIGATFLMTTMCAKEDMIWQHQREYRGAEAEEHLDAMYAKPEIDLDASVKCGALVCSLKLPFASHSSTPLPSTLSLTQVPFSSSSSLPFWALGRNAT
ncbi:hypothetical protein AC1031_019547 [Aphanomyces cochlioides]|nr:hypothetical protein AC1031_019547 [Aphanomyces cochlioides]